MDAYERIKKKMREQIEKFNQWAMNMNLDNTPVGLYSGRMGLCVYFYELAKLTSEKRYYAFAEKLFDDVLNNISENMVNEPYGGLTGICLSINYLLENKYTKGDPNIMLKNLDDKIIQSLISNRNIDDDKRIDLDAIMPVLGSLMYLTIRLQNVSLSKDEQKIMQGAIIENINLIESIQVDKFVEPYFFAVSQYFMPFYLHLLQQTYQLNYYNYKIEKIFEELSPHLLYRYPLNKVYRLMLCYEMSEIASTVGSIPGWNDHTEILQQNLDILQIINSFRNKQIFFSNGLCGFYYLLRKMGLEKEYNDLLLNRIADSEVWDQWPKNDLALKSPLNLFGGLPGVILTYYHILYNSNITTFFDFVIRHYF